MHTGIKHRHEHQYSIFNALLASLLLLKQETCWEEVWPLTLKLHLDLFSFFFYIRPTFKIFSVLETTNIKIKWWRKKMRNLGLVGLVKRTEREKLTANLRGFISVSHHLKYQNYTLKLNSHVFNCWNTRGSVIFLNMCLTDIFTTSLIFPVTSPCCLVSVWIHITQDVDDAEPDRLFF